MPPYFSTLFPIDYPVWKSSAVLVDFKTTPVMCWITISKRLAWLLMIHKEPFKFNIFHWLSFFDLAMCTFSKDLVPVWLINLKLPLPGACVLLLPCLHEEMHLIGQLIWHIGFLLCLWPMIALLPLGLLLAIVSSQVNYSTICTFSIVPSNLSSKIP